MCFVIMKNDYAFGRFPLAYFRNRKENLPRMRISALLLLASLASSLCAQSIDYSSASALRPAPDLWRITDDDEWVLIPIAGNAPGAFGTHFRSDLTLINYRPVSQRVNIRMLALNADSYSEPWKTVTLEANSSLTIEDVVGTLLGKSGIGALEIKAVGTNDLLDLDAKIDATSRIWTTQPGGSGTYSQTTPAVRWTGTTRDAPVYLLGLRQDEDFRTNIGIVNFDSSAPPRVFDVAVTGSRGSTTFTITTQAPMSLIQVPVPAGVYGPMTVTITPRNVPGFWIAYGSSVDNRTGDGWVTNEVQPSP